MTDPRDFSLRAVIGDCAHLALGASHPQELQNAVARLAISVNAILDALEIEDIRVENQGGMTRLTTKRTDGEEQVRLVPTSGFDRNGIKIHRPN